MKILSYVVYLGEYHREVEDSIAGISTKIVLLKTSKREGLIRARLFGARLASGKVIIIS